MRLMRQDAPIHLPVFQRFDCHGCGFCCHSVVNVTAEERRRILAAGWEARIPGQPMFVAYRYRRRRLHRLATNRDGGCVFLDGSNRCRLHAESGAELKPLACRLYPFVPTPGAGSVRLDLRADCPSVAANRGRPITVHGPEIRDLVRETGVHAMAAIPSWPGARPLTASEFDTVVEAFLACLKKTSLSLRARLQAGCHLLDLFYQVRPEKVRDERFNQLVRDTLAPAAIAQAQESQPGGEVRKRAGRLFRQWLFLHSLADDPAHLDDRRWQRVRRSWQRYGQSKCFARGAGPVPRLRPDWPETSFEAVTAVLPAPDDSLEPLCRSLTLKLDAHAFAGPGYFGYDLITGLTALWLLPAVVGWFARLAAVKAGRGQLAAGDILDGVRRAHHTFGVSPVFTRISERLRLRALAREQVPGVLLAAYGP